jgi:hypothetical protein
MQSKFETVGNHLIASVQMTVIDCDDYNEASTKTGDVARWLLKKYKAAEPEKQTVRRWLPGNISYTSRLRGQQPHRVQFTSRNSV